MRVVHFDQFEGTSASITVNSRKTDIRIAGLTLYPILFVPTGTCMKATTPTDKRKHFLDFPARYRLRTIEVHVNA